MKRILVDMDGVLADIYSQFHTFEERETGNRIPSEETIGKPELEAFPNGMKHIHSEGFFRQAPPMPGSKEGLDYLNDHHNVFVVSSATQFPQSLREKHDWLSEHYPFISWKQMIFCGDKSAISGNIMIDDHPKNLKSFDGERIIFSQPHNLLIDEHPYKRVRGWNELIAHFKA